MKMSRVVALAFAVATVGLMTGGALAMVAGPSTVNSISAPWLPSVVYEIPAVLPTHVADFSPYMATVHTLGAVQFHFLSQNGYPQLYQLRGTGVTVMVPPHGVVAMIATLNQPGEFAWITLLPSPGVPPGTVVGVLNVLPPT